MWNHLVELWRNIPWFIRVPLDFWLSVIIVRGILAKDVTSWLEDRGIIKSKEKSLVYRFLDFTYAVLRSVYKLLLKVMPSIERHAAIFSHYKEEHSSQSALECVEGRCSIFLS